MYPRAYRPLIIVGRQRAGTRYLTDLLNTFDEVAIQGEIPTRLMESIVGVIEEIESHYARNATTGDEKRERHYTWWRRKKERLLFAIWENVSQGRPVAPGPKTKYFGYKRPNNERYFDFYETTFAFHPPFYVYCTRNFVDNYLSIVSRWPERRIEDVAEDYLASIKQYNKMKAAAPDRVLLFNLDDHIRYGLEHIERNVIHPLALKPTEQHLEKLRRMRGRNRTEKDLKIPRRKELTGSERRFVEKHPELESAFQALCSVPVREGSQPPER